MHLFVWMAALAEAQRVSLPPSVRDPGSGQLGPGEAVGPDLSVDPRVFLPPTTEAEDDEDTDELTETTTEEVEEETTIYGESNSIPSNDILLAWMRDNAVAPRAATGGYGNLDLGRE
eukprot:Gregarina_sp_Pseudo_9__191@NODE_1124_length_1857_cov_33_200770_g1051_i0_p4_GENE_NODE_1124_length_1857_cov_33_200770_g1051_i0NODE_1124_length_1857_cov_33_200770_g1051_i0_p4_ORF_typecomplete_len117_score12_15_NODE_1124_length_1857_cov_33_200770_g1051_i058408